MCPDDEDDKPTVVLDLNALKKQRLKQEEDLANIGQDLEFNIGESSTPKSAPAPSSATPTKASFKVILFDFQSDFFKKSLPQFPKGPNYQIATNLNELNQHLKSKEFQLVIFNYDVNPKAVNQLCAQIKQKLPTTKTMIMAKAISPQKAKLHASTPSGANGYYQFPLDTAKLEKELVRIQQNERKVS